MNQNNPFSFRKFLKSFSYAFSGFIFFIRKENNAKVHLFITILVIFAGFVFDISFYEWLSVMICIGIVFCAELFNTAIEELCNKVEPNYNESIKKIKDLSSAAVLIVSIISLIVAIIIFIPKIIQLF